MHAPLPRPRAQELDRSHQLGGGQALDWRALRERLEAWAAGRPVLKLALKLAEDAALYKTVAKQSMARRLEDR